MALKIWLNGSMKDITKYTSNRLFTFVGGQKKALKKGITFINGQKKVLWEIGSMGFDAWSPTQLGYPNNISIYDRIYGVFANENKVVYNINKYISRANISNVSSPYNENTVQNGMICYNKGITGSYYNYNAYLYDIVSFGGQFAGWSEDLSINNIQINSETANIDVAQLTTSRKNHDGLYTQPYRHTYPNMIYTNGNGLVCVSNGVLPSGGSSYHVYKNHSLAGTTEVATILSNGFNGTNIPLLLASVLYDNRYVLFGAEYQATSSSNIIYSLKKVDLNTGTITTLLDNYNTPVTGILIDNTNILVSVGNYLIKIDINGNILDTYTSPNIMPTLVGKSNGFYYITTTRNNNNRNYMNLEIIDENNFQSGEVKQTNIPMIYTFALPCISSNGYLCFSTQHYVASDVYGDLTTASNRTKTMRSSTNGVNWTEQDTKICRIRCY